MNSVVERFISEALREAKENGTSPEAVIHSRLQSLSEMIGGYDFADVVAAYWRGHDSGNDQLKSDAVRWLRAEFTTRTDARSALAVRTIVDDASVYDHLKLIGAVCAMCWIPGVVRHSGRDGKPLQAGQHAGAERQL